MAASIILAWIFAALAFVGILAILVIYLRALGSEDVIRQAQAEALRQYGDYIGFGFPEVREHVYQWATHVERFGLPTIRKDTHG